MPCQKFLVYRRFIALFSGVLELLIALGLLYTPTRSVTALFLMVFLVAIYPANIVQINYYSQKYTLRDGCCGEFVCPTDWIDLLGIFVCLSLFVLCNPQHD